MLKREDAVLAVVDIQGKLAQLMCDRDALFGNVCKMIRGAQVLDVPILWTAQRPEALGPTTPQVAELLPGEPIPKTAFSCCREPAFEEALAKLGRKQVILTGIEAHICIYQTARDLVATAHEVYVPADCVSSRSALNRETALRMMTALGAKLTCVEAALFEMVGDAADARFRHIPQIIK